MKKIIFLCSCIITCFTIEAREVEFSAAPRIIKLDDLSLEKIQEFIQTKDSNCVLELQKGTNFPVQFVTKAHFVSSMIDPNLSFSIDKTCYLRVIDKKCYLSVDLENWEKPKRFFTGQTSLQIKPSQTNSGVVLETELLAPACKTAEEIE